ncbi:hypothetical protein BZA70DRAFT_276938 [Myxozyma melibiosi]|uniref:DM2 domain-containing protein n=1 Tax=Myxozyma melibiosi TaxID=54550 RepID=A0ABR1F9H1_9ASCO
MSYYPQQPPRQSTHRPHRKSSQKATPYPPQPPPVAPHPHGVPPHVQPGQAQAPQIDKRFVRRPVERNIPPKVEALIPEAKLYKDLRDVEQSMDATISRKRLDVEDMLAKGTKERRKLLLVISNTAVDQPWQTVDRLDENAFDFDIGTIPSWVLNITGRLVGDETPVDDPKHVLFTSYFQSIAVELDRPKELYPEGNVVVWSSHTKPGMPPQPPTDNVEIKRKGDSDVNARISFYLKTSPERYKLSPALSNVLGGLQEQTRQEVVMGLWQYVKFHGLQDPDEKRSISLDDGLREVFNNQERLSFAQLIDYVGPHLLPLDPVVVDFTIRVDKDTMARGNEMTREITVEVDSPRRQQLQGILANWYDKQDEIHALDEQIGITIQELANSKLRRDFFTQMSSDPAGFINRWIGSQARDLEIVLGDREFQNEEVRRAEYYQNEDLKESIFLLVNGRK